MTDKPKPNRIDCSATTQATLAGDVRAGFPSPAGDTCEALDLTSLLVRHPASTYFFRISGVSMVDAGLDEGDIIIVDRSIEPYNNCKAICYIDGEYTLKRVEISAGCVRLMPANGNDPRFKPMTVTPENDFMVWGVATYVIKKIHASKK